MHVCLVCVCVRVRVRVCSCMRARVRVACALRPHGPSKPDATATSLHRKVQHRHRHLHRRPWRIYTQPSTTPDTTATTLLYYYYISLYCYIFTLFSARLAKQLENNGPSHKPLLRQTETYLTPQKTNISISKNKNSRQPQTGSPNRRLEEHHQHETTERHPRKCHANWARRHGHARFSPPNHNPCSCHITPIDSGTKLSLVASCSVHVALHPQSRRREFCC